MTEYCVNKEAQPNGDHEVHTLDCNHLPDENNRKHLGEFSNCFGAVTEAKKHFPKSNGCYYCSNVCHTS